MLYNIFILLHITFCLLIIILILMQQGKGAEAGASFNNTSQTFFGSKGSKTFLIKLTAFITILFFLNCFTIGILYKKFQLKDEGVLLDKKKDIIINKRINEEYNSKLDDIPIE